VHQHDDPSAFLLVSNLGRENGKNASAATSTTRLICGM
jgi:hypothetical protein